MSGRWSPQKGLHKLKVEAKRVCVLAHKGSEKRGSDEARELLRTRSSSTRTRRRKREESGGAEQEEDASGEGAVANLLVGRMMRYRFPSRATSPQTNKINDTIVAKSK